MRGRLVLCLVAAVLLSLPACVSRILPAAGIWESPPYPPGSLGVHLRNGDLVVLTEWEVEGEPPEWLVGAGQRYDARRRMGAAGPVRIPYDSVVLVESTVVDEADPLIGEGFGTGALVVFTGLTGFITMACLVDPKACFGSCPTVYADPADDRPVAEAFSESVARAFESRDVDALPTVHPEDGQVRLTVRNEALETHAIRSFRLVAVRPGPAGVGAGDDGYRGLDRVIEPASCAAPEGDCLEAVARLDGSARRTWTDSTDLSARERVELTFPAAAGPTGLLVSARHTFVSTFLFYQMMAYLGPDAAPVIAAVERGEPLFREAFLRGVRMLGDIEVEVEREGRWESVGTYREPGPLATDTRLIPLQATDGPTRVRLTMTRGYWRLDAVRLAELGPPADARVLEPAVVERHGRPDGLARDRLLAQDRWLVTYPGDRYDVTFEVPPELDDAVFFLEATGYYYEWMRKEWLEERDPAMVSLFILRPNEVFRRLAPSFKASEANMEQLFWASRFGRRP